MPNDMERLREAEASARRLARKIDKGLPKGWMFVLNLFDSKSRHTTYIASCRPEEVPAALRECADYIERREAGKAPRGM